MRAYIDGSSKGLYGYLLKPSNKLRVIQDYPTTNNQAEWLAFLTLLVDLEVNTSIKVYSDSQIVVNQFSGEFETRNEVLKYLRKVCFILIKSKNLKIDLEWISRNKNPYGKHLEKIVRKEREKRKKIRNKLRKKQR